MFLDLPLDLELDDGTFEGLAHIVYKLDADDLDVFVTNITGTLYGDVATDLNLKPTDHLYKEILSALGDTLEYACVEDAWSC